jgi:photosystem II stability/assembly factor-like uncharacterized protein
MSIARRNRSKPQAAKIIVGAATWVTIAALAAAGLFIRPSAVGKAITPGAVQPGDPHFGMASPRRGTLWVVGDYGRVVTSVDDGKNWVAARVPTTEHLQDIDAWDEHRAVAIGNGATVLTSADGAKTWISRPAPHSDIGSKMIRVHAGAGGTAWVVGEYGAIIYSADWGATWVRRRAEEDISWNDIAVLGDGLLCVVGEHGRILRSSDNGTTWSEVDGGVKTSLFALAFADARTGLAVGLEGVVLLTNDAGKSWRRIALPDQSSQHLFAGAWDAAHMDWIVAGQQGVVWSIDLDGKAPSRLPSSARDLSWRTKVIVVDGAAYLTGATLSRLPAKRTPIRALGSDSEKTG